MLIFSLLIIFEGSLVLLLLPRHWLLRLQHRSMAGQPFYASCNLDFATSSLYSMASSSSDFYLTIFESMHDTSSKEAHRFSVDDYETIVQGV